MAQFTRDELDKVVKATRKQMSSTYNMSFSKVQQMTTIDRGVRGPRWVAKTTFPAPPVEEGDACSVILNAIKQLGDGSEKYEVPPDLRAPVAVQWVGHRPGVDRDAAQPDISEQAKFTALTEACSSELVIMYMYGGGHFLNGPATRRATAGLLSKLTGGRCMIVQHRLAPQSAFPCQIVDVFHAYLSLLYPPEGSLHTPINPRHIVFAADSSGAQLAMGVLQAIAAAHRQGHHKIRFHGLEVSLPMPAGLTLQSPSLTAGRLGSWDAQAATDYLPTNYRWFPPSFPTDSIWPSKPPRETPYCHARTFLHPMTIPVTGTKWTGLPPIYMAVGGGEMLLDAAKYVAQEAARQGVAVIWDEYELMPHNWPMLMPQWPQAKKCMEAWAETCVRFAGRGMQEHGVESSARVVGFEGDVREMDVRHLTSLTEGQVKRAMLDVVEDLEESGRDIMKEWRSKL